MKFMFIVSTSAAPVTANLAIEAKFKFFHNLALNISFWFRIENIGRVNKSKVMLVSKRKFKIKVKKAEFQKTKISHFIFLFTLYYCLLLRNIYYQTSYTSKRVLMNYGEVTFKKERLHTTWQNWNVSKWKICSLADLNLPIFTHFKFLPIPTIPTHFKYHYLMH